MAEDQDKRKVEAVKGQDQLDSSKPNVCEINDQDNAKYPTYTVKLMSYKQRKLLLRADFNSVLSPCRSGDRDIPTCKKYTEGRIHDWS